MGKTNSAKKWLLFAAGLFIGWSVTVAAGMKAYETVRRMREPKRFDTRAMLTEDRVHTLADGTKVFAASSLDRVFRDGYTLAKPAWTREAALSLAGHEYESFQIVVAAGTDDLPAVQVKVSDLVSEQDGAAVAKSKLTVRAVGYVPTIKPYYPVKYVGEWPDPLMPETRVHVPAGNFQPFWITLYVPPGTPAGNYRATVTVDTGSQRQDIPLQVRVYGFDVPVEGRLKTAFDLYGHITEARYPRTSRETEETYKERIGHINGLYLRAMLQYRMNPILNVDPTNDTHLALVDRLRVLGLNNFSIGRHGGTFANNWPSSDKAIENLFGLYRTYGEMLKLNKMLPYTYIYTWDEGNIGNPRVAKIASMIHRAYPDLKNMVCYHGFWDPDTNPEWGKDIDIWTFQIDNFVELKMRKLQKIGKEVWMYISGPSGYDSPNLAIDFDSIDYRIVPWLSWKYDIKGFLYWCVNWWPKANPFKTAKNTDWEQNGNGLMFYPGKDGPIASLRLEIFRDGMEDYEYIQELMERLKILKQQDNDPARAKFMEESIAILTVDDTIAASMFSFTKDGEALKARRNTIAEKIEEFDRIFVPSPVEETEHAAP